MNLSVSVLNLTSENTPFWVMNIHGCLKLFTNTTLLTL